MTDQVATAAFVHRPDTSNSYWYVSNLMTFLARSEDTGGQYTVMEATAPHGDGPPLHVHGNDDEGIYIIEGAFTFYVGGQLLDAPAGSFVFLPRRVPHTFRVDSERARALAFGTPAGLEHFFEPLSTPAPALVLPPPPSGPPDMARFQEVAASVGNRIVGPPLSILLGQQR